jgi:hypothetical protein
MLAASDLTDVTSRTLVMVGDHDEVTLEHAVAMYRGLPDPELMVVPGTSRAPGREPRAVQQHHRRIPNHRSRGHDGTDPSGNLCVSGATQLRETTGRGRSRRLHSLRG